MYDYNTSREPMRLREFGRNIQNLAKYIKTLPTKEERTRYAEALIELMKQVVPTVRDNSEENMQRLWDDLYMMADYDLDVDSPFPPPDPTVLERKPDRVEYSSNNIRFRHYGRNIQKMIEDAKKIEDKEVQEAAVFQIARLMKSFHVTWNKEVPDNETIAKNIAILSDGELQLNVAKAEELDLLGPLFKERTWSQKSPGKGGRMQNRRRRTK